MAQSEILSRAWKLRTHPFEPETDRMGRPIKRRCLRGTLDPNTEPGTVSFYFDVYDWTNADLIHALSKDEALAKFPEIDDIFDESKTVLVVISGFRRTGRESLRNLILYKATQKSSYEPIIVEAKLSGHNRAGLVKSLARNFIDDFTDEEADPSREELERIYERESLELETDPNSLTLFERIRKRVRKCCNRPIVLLPKAEHYDTWQLIYEATEGLVTLIILCTPSDVYAEICANTLMNEGKKVEHIKACELDLAKARDYLRDRISLLRLDEPSAMNLIDIAPFSDVALQALYQDGGQPDRERPLTFPIGMLNKTFQYSVDKQLEELTQLVEQGEITALDSLDPDLLLIQPAQILGVRKEINEGN